MVSAVPLVRNGFTLSATLENALEWMSNQPVTCNRGPPRTNLRAFSPIDRVNGVSGKGQRP